MVEKANDAIADIIAPLLDDLDEEYYSDGEERSFMKTQMVWWRCKG